MAKRSILCKSCGQSFEVDSKLSRAFCLYCGAENSVPAQTAPSAAVDLLKLSTDPATRKAQLEQLTASSDASAATARDRLLFWAARFERVGRHENRYGDKFVEFISTLIFYSQNYPSRGAMKRARKDRDRFLARPVMLKAMAETTHPKALLLQEFYDAAEIYLKACHDDKHYGSKLFELVKLKEEDIAIKAAEDVAIGMMGYLCQLGMTPQTDLLILALHKAYAAVFTKYPDLLDETISRQPTEIRTMLYHILSIDPSQQEEAK